MFCCSTFAFHLFRAIVSARIDCDGFSSAAAQSGPCMCVLFCCFIWFHCVHLLSLACLSKGVSIHTQYMHIYGNVAFHARRMSEPSAHMVSLACIHTAAMCEMYQSWRRAEITIAPKRPQSSLQCTPAEHAIFRHRQRVAVLSTFMNH